MNLANSPAFAIPVLLLLFRRPDTTRRILDRLRLLRPSYLVVVADGPRSDVPDEGRLCRASRRELALIDWPCKVERLFSATNLGIAASLDLGMRHVFRSHERVIVLEDDCLPDPSFFSFCAALLERYADMERVMAIAGSNLGVDIRPEGGSYAFSRYQVLWGWATWKRAWRHQDMAMGQWPACAAMAGVRRNRLAGHRAGNAPGAALLGLSLPHQPPHGGELGLCLDLQLLAPRRALHPPGGEPGAQPGLPGGCHPHRLGIEPRGAAGGAFPAASVGASDGRAA